jgi:hypothetical protein
MTEASALQEELLPTKWYNTRAPMDFCCCSCIHLANSRDLPDPSGPEISSGGSGPAAETCAFRRS